MTQDPRTKLIRQLQLAYSGELAAGYAYRGHWRSVTDEAERSRIRTIEEEEWHHRALVGRILKRLGAKPRLAREVRALLVGRILGFLCHLSPWFLPMYGAGKLESRNVKEYEDAASDAATCGEPEFIDCLLTMAEVEWEHERYFRSKVEGHPWTRFFGLWTSLKPKETIRSSRSET